MRKVFYTDPYRVVAAKDEVRSTENYLNEFSNTLADLGLTAGVKGLFERMEIGASAELDAAMSEIEEYISRTRMPEYLQADARQKARESVDEDILRKLGPLVSRFPAGLKKDDVLEVDGKLRLTKAYKERYVKERSTFELPPEVAEDVDAFQKFLDEFEKWNERYDMINYVYGQLRYGKIINAPYVMLAARRPKQK